MWVCAFKMLNFATWWLPRPGFAFTMCESILFSFKCSISYRTYVMSHHIYSYFFIKGFQLCECHDVKWFLPLWWYTKACKKLTHAVRMCAFLSALRCQLSKHPKRIHRKMKQIGSLPLQHDACHKATHTFIPTRLSQFWTFQYSFTLLVNDYDDIL